jgi:hypothetical protein
MVMHLRLWPAICDPTNLTLSGTLASPGLNLRCMVHSRAGTMQLQAKVHGEVTLHGSDWVVFGPGGGFV